MAYSTRTEPAEGRLGALAPLLAMRRRVRQWKTQDDVRAPWWARLIPVRVRVEPVRQGDFVRIAEVRSLLSLSTWRRLRGSDNTIADARLAR